MRIRKVYQGNLADNKIVNAASNSQTNTYSCDYINKLPKVDELLSATTTSDTYTISDIEQYNLIVVVAGNGNSQRWGRNSMILPVNEIKKAYGDLSSLSYELRVWATSTTSALKFAFPSKTSVVITCDGDRTGLLGLYGVKL